MPLRASLLLLVLAAPPGVAQYRGRPTGPADTVLRTMAAAEAHGRRHPALPDTGRQAPFLVMSGPGSAERRCVPVGEYTGVRTGDFWVGPFIAWGPGFGKMSFMPAVPQRFGQPKVPLVVRAVRTDSAAARPMVFEYPELNAQAHPSGHWFYSTDPAFPSTGTWLMVVTAGPNWGCVVSRIGYPVDRRRWVDTTGRGS